MKLAVLQSARNLQECNWKRRKQYGNGTGTGMERGLEWKGDWNGKEPEWNGEGTGTGIERELEWRGNWNGK